MAKLPYISKSDFTSLTGVSLLHVDHVGRINSFSTDTRTLKKGDLFIALFGDKFNGHDYLEKAIDSGAKAVLIHETYKNRVEKTSIPAICVPDTIKALGELAALWRQKLSTKIIAITGSNGKTSTKDLLFTLLSQSFKVIATQANNNNHIGVPLTLLSINNSYDYAIVEAGTNHFGEIEYSARMINPDYSIITNIGPSHLEFFNTVEGVLQEKQTLFTFTRAGKKNIFINNDDPLLRSLKKKFQSVIQYGFKGSVDFKGTITKAFTGGYPGITIAGHNKTLSFVSPLLGKSNAQNLLAAISIVWSLGLTKKKILQAVKNIKPAHGRLESFVQNSNLIIDDTYNANPNSMLAAFEVLRNFKAYKNKVVILGDMFELGANAVDEHIKLMNQLLQFNNLSIYLCGNLMYHLSHELNMNDIDNCYSDSRLELIEHLQHQSFSESVILVKGSRGMKMEEIVAILKEKGNH